ncbi:MAG TPA: mismatch-specific DNA-glycosylase [Microbacteriaceae bacterium]
MGFTRAQLDSFRGKTLPDLLGPDTRLLFVGINPGLRAVAVQADFGSRGNRFYPALYRAGIVDRVIDASEGFENDDLEQLKCRHVGITKLVAAATARADELSADQLIRGAGALAERVARIRPRVAAMLGITAYRVAFGMPKATTGLQPNELAGVPLWVVPNPSGLNAHATIDTLGRAYREVAIAAGIDVYDLTIPSARASTE